LFFYLDGRTDNIRSSCSGGLDFKFWTDQILHSFQTIRHRLDIYTSNYDVSALYRVVGPRYLVHSFIVIGEIE